MSRYYEGFPARCAGGAVMTLPPPPLSHPSRSATWTSEPPRPRIDRFKPERSRHHVQKLPWKASAAEWVDGFPEMVGSMTIADVSPRFAVKRILLLYENAQYREAANFINRLSHSTFKTILGQLPIDLFIEAMPHSVSILEALYAKVFLSSDCGVKILRPDSVLSQLIKLFCGGQGSAERWLGSARKLLKVIVLSEPKLKKSLQVKRRTLDKAVEGLGQHGLVGTSDETLANLHDALKVEFQKLVDTYRTALAKLEELSLASKKDKDVNKGPAPVQISHQRQLSLKQSDIQERLIKNKTVLNVVEPAMGSRSLEVLLAILRRRVECDKDALFQFTQLKKELKNDHENVVAPILMTYSHAIDQVLEMMKEVGEDDGGDDEDDSSDISGYHSDSDSAIMMSGNSPYVTKRARHNFISRSVRSTSNRSTRTCLQMSTSSSDTPPDRGTDWEWSGSKSNSGMSCGSGDSGTGNERSKKSSSSSSSAGGGNSVPPPPPPPPAPGGNVLSMAHGKPPSWCSSCQSKATLQVMPPIGGDIVTVSTNPAVDHSREVAALQSELESTRVQLDQVRTRLDAVTAQHQAKELSGVRLVRCYANLYSQGRAEALTALDALPQLAHASELKSKILFSVIVLAFRAAGSQLATKREQVRRVLLAPVSSAQAASQDLEAAVGTFLRRTVDTYDLTRPIEEVSSQLWATLYDYPSLKTCQGLVQYIKDSVRLAWALVNQSPSYELEYEERTFRRDLHVKYHTSNVESGRIATYLWPALLEGPGGPCVHKAVVLT